MKEKLMPLKPSEETLLSYLLIGTLLYRCLPYLLCVSILTMTKKPIHQILYYFLEYSGILILPLAAIVLWKILGYENKKAALASAMLVGFSDMLNVSGGILLQEKLLAHLLKYPILYYLLCILLFLVSITIFIKSLPGEKYSLRLMSKLYIICILGSMGKWLLDGIVGIFANYIYPSFGTNMLLRGIGAIVDGCVLYFVFRYVTKESGEKTVKSIWKNRIIVAGVGMLVCLLAECILLSAKPEKCVQAVIAEDIAMGSSELIQGNVEAAATYYHNAFERKAAWEYALGISDDSRYLRSMENSSLLEVKYIYWQCTNNIAAMERYLLEQDENVDFAIELLDIYAQQEKELSERSQAIQKDIISLMIANGIFTDNVLAVKDLEDRKYKLTEGLAEMQQVEIYVDAVDILSQTGKNGAVNRELTENMLSIAEQRPQDISLQYFAVMYGCAYKDDNATHYKRTLQAAERFISLLGKQDNVTDVQRYQGKLQLVEWAMELGLYDAAVTYIDEALAYQETEGLLVTLAQCQNDLGRMEDCYETSQRILEINPNNYGAIYYCTVASLKNGNVDEAIDFTIQLCDIVQSLDGLQQHQAEVMLYDVLQYQGFSDLTYNSMIYRRLTEEQRQKINTNEFYAAYLDAVYYCFTDKKYDFALERIEYVLSKEEELSQAQYLKGCIYFGLKDYDNAAKAYEKSVAVDASSATAWYSLANAYDALGRYEDAYEASIRVDSLLPDTDHLFDPYGIAIHNNWLKERLAQHLGVKGE